MSNETGTDLMKSMTPEQVAHLDQAGPQKISAVIEDLLEENPQTFPVYNLYAVRDLDMKAYVELTPHLNDMMAYRHYQQLVQNGDPRYSNRPDRFVLHYVGQWDQGNTDIIPDDKRVMMTLQEIRDGS